MSYKNVFFAVLLGLLVAYNPGWAQKTEQQVTLDTKLVEADPKWSISLGVDWDYSFTNFDDVNENNATFDRQAAAFPNYDVSFGEGIDGSSSLGGELALWRRISEKCRIAFAMVFDCFCPQEVDQGWTYTVDPRFYSMDGLNIHSGRISPTVKAETRLSSDNGPLSRVRAGAEVGVDFNRVRIDYDFTRQLDILTGIQYERGTLKDNNVGFHVGAHINWNLYKDLYLTVGGGYYWGSFKDITGALTNETDETYDARLSMTMIENGYILGSYRTDNPIPADTRNAELDFSGVKLRIGIRYQLPLGW